jgi:hypothetical protein
MNDFNPRAISDVECGCGCGVLMTMGWLHGSKRGLRKYLYGHCPQVSVPTRVSGVRKNVKSNMGPEQIDSYFGAQVDQLTSNSEKLKEEAKDLLAKAKLKMKQASEIDQQICDIRTVRDQTSAALGRIFSKGAK